MTEFHSKFLFSIYFFKGHIYEFIIFLYNLTQSEISCCHHLASVCLSKPKPFTFQSHL